MVCGEIDSTTKRTTERKWSLSQTTLTVELICTAIIWSKTIGGCIQFKFNMLYLSNYFKGSEWWFSTQQWKGWMGAGDAEGGQPCSLHGFDNSSI